MEEKLEKIIRHLEMIQGVINRMAHNSFLLKGWTVTLIAASVWLLARSGKCEAASEIMWIAFIVVMVFWVLSGYFLRQERLFRKLYDKVRKSDDTDFSMNHSELNEQVPSWAETCFYISMRNTLLIFYAPLLLVVIFLL